MIGVGKPVALQVRMSCDFRVSVCDTGNTIMSGEPKNIMQVT